ncbi:multicopper oxidase family protein [Streptomyces spirodelae]|uniref:Multicopper oxidase family protein n=1 Tax=Streptomyces spirodelae TaxID=2812904 RepID=A0ABS3WND5_9ACTN|nr:multicopper oxidase family protein [Streptomyces spirodelae]MBO8184633.1 multicopper oxidase family protein [Streptomyces spirodelae]
MRSHFTRRAVLGTGAALAGAGFLTACSDTARRSDAKSPAGYVESDGPEVRAAEARRARGRTERVRLTATRTRLELGAEGTVPTWAYGDRVPGKEIRVGAGGTLDVTLANHLSAPTSVHWHGLALRNDMDGVPGLTQREIRPGADFTYRFAVPDPGTYWFHPHSGGQRDRGLYAPLIVEDPREPLRYDKEWVVVLDDWLDGVDGSSPDGVLAELRRGMDHGAGHGGKNSEGGKSDGKSDGGGHDMHGMHGMGGSRPAGKGPSRVLMGATSELLGGDAGDVQYPYYLVNGRTATDPETFRAEPGDRIRIRFINAGGDTAFRVALGGHRMTVTHTDGYPVEHKDTDALLLGMGERYDVLVTAEDGVFPLTALAEGKKATARAMLRTAPGAAPAASVRPEELERGRPLTAGQLEAAESARLSPGRPDRTVTLRLTGSMAAYDWGFNGKQYTPDQRHPVTAGERVRLRFVNTTEMWHPLHLHGHTFALPDGGARKDTAIVLPGKTLEADFEADNPGLWLVHCHNVYHSQAGMMTVLGYRK